MSESLPSVNELLPEKDREPFIQEMMKEMDFKKIHKAMVAIDWKWAFHGERKLRVPTMGEVVAVAFRMLHEAVESRGEFELQGSGFRIRREPNDLTIVFSLDHWTIDVDEFKEGRE